MAKKCLGFTRKVECPFLRYKPGAVERAMGRRLIRALEIRNAARYKFTATVSREDTESVLDLVKDLIALLEDTL